MILFGFAYQKEDALLLYTTTKDIFVHISVERISIWESILSLVSYYAWTRPEFLSCVRITSFVWRKNKTRFYSDKTKLIIVSENNTVLVDCHLVKRLISACRSIHLLLYAHTLHLCVFVCTTCKNISDVSSENRTTKIASTIMCTSYNVRVWSNLVSVYTLKMIFSPWKCQIRPIGVHNEWLIRTFVYK